MSLYRRHSSNEAPMFGTMSHKLSANEVADATDRAVRTIRWSESANNIVSLAKDISEATKGSRKPAVREEMLQDIANLLYSLDEVIVRRRIVPDVLTVIRTASFISPQRKDKAAAQFKIVVSALDRVLN